MPGCRGDVRFLAALQRKGWCRNDEVCGRRLAILFSEQLRRPPSIWPMSRSLWKALAAASSILGRWCFRP